MKAINMYASILEAQSELKTPEKTMWFPVFLYIGEHCRENDAWKKALRFIKCLFEVIFY